MMIAYYLLGGVGFWLILLTIFLYKSISHYNRLTADVSKKDLVSSLNQLISKTEQNGESIQKLTEKLEKNIEENKKHIQKVGFIRYNPFTDTGGDQSFSLCLLDENNNGIMISSLHSRENTRLYSKKIEGGVAQNQVLSKEEQEVIKQALK